MGNSISHFYKAIANKCHVTTICFLVILSVCSCASLPKDVERIPSYKISPKHTSALNTIIEPATQAHPDQSGVVLLHEAERAFRARHEMTALAEHSLDVQYYIWQNDKAGRILAQRLLSAANRGVRIRVLLDDFSLHVKDSYLVAFATHPNIHIRIFNPFTDRNTKDLGFITDIERVNHRMHNKLFVLDNSVAVVGGRNIGDNYFGIKDSYNSRDIDILTIGPVVDQVSQSFDEYWNSDWAYPIQSIYKHKMDDERANKLREDINKQASLDLLSFPFTLETDKNKIIETARSGLNTLNWAHIDVIFDPSDKFDGDPNTVTTQFNTTLGEVQHEMLAEIAYFVPGNAMVAGFKEAHKNGVHIRFLTNSLNSTEVLPAYAGFANYRKKLLQAGVELYEYRSDAKERSTWPKPSHQALSRLHSKTFVVDRRYSFIGSYNFDPRSMDINTEIGLLIDSPEFAKKVIKVLDSGIEPGNAWKLELDEQHQRLEWHDQQGSPALYKEPHSTWWQRFKTSILRMLPIEHQL
ncbi:phosphatidylserine/phosphatidylglycerophosphate/cardiolipin synthase family protein [Agaribacterium sp. ZY112]|uniref:phospholipase D-like domain-containing protein n=1 Tax=Agaribacterium sp. ZY112 TaxID=3233574 RepID=UPI0035269229